MSIVFNPLDYPMAFETPRWLSGVSAWSEHIPFAFAIVDGHEPATYVELGTHAGDSYCAFCQAVDTLRLDTRCFAVDTWKGDIHSGGYEEHVYLQLRSQHDARYSKFSTLLRCTFRDALSRFEKGSVDLLHIDGLHTYEAVSQDFYDWLPKMSERGVVLFHDTAVRRPDFGVWKLWEELTPKYPSFAFDHGSGLGVLAVGALLSPFMERLCKSPDDIRDAAKLYYAAFGQRITLAHTLNGMSAERANLLAQIAHLQKS